MNYLPSINSQKETDNIVNFIQKTLQEQKIEKVVIGLSGGIDSSTSLYLLKKSIPKENIIVSHLHYFEPLNLEQITYDIPTKNIHNFSIKTIVDNLSGLLEISSHRHSDQAKPDSESQPRKKILNQVQDDSKVRLGNIMARVRMIMLYDLAKKQNALVCGTENKSEYYLGYFTRFGDEASDFEPIRHLYKTHVYKLASYLGIPKKIIEQKPTAGLWQGQTDEQQLGFSYQEADCVLYLYFEKKQKIEEIKNQGFANAEKIIEWCRKNEYKHHTPYSLLYSSFTFSL